MNQPVVAGLAVATTAGLLAIIRSCVVRVAGESMHPTLQAGDLLVTVPLRARGRTVRVGDVVVISDPRGREVVKRVSAVAGGWTDVMDGPIVVPDGHVAVAGDDPARSTDSRHYGPLPEAALRSTAVLSLSRRRPILRAIRSGGFSAPRDMPIPRGR